MESRLARDCIAEQRKLELFTDAATVYFYTQHAHRSDETRVHLEVRENTNLARRTDVVEAVGRVVHDAVLFRSHVALCNRVRCTTGFQISSVYRMKESCSYFFTWERLRLESRCRRQQRTSRAVGARDAHVDSALRRFRWRVAVFLETAVNTG